ncbi:hypothetical protein F5I97DRAFT_1634535 [Phlebopus sp. FC_14]|nr:hypothetical protein F5I97DRAFT_1634535 [Phlebopus sp. FC_14]
MLLITDLHPTLLSHRKIGNRCCFLCAILLLFPCLNRQLERIVYEKPCCSKLPPRQLPSVDDTFPPWCVHVLVSGFWSRSTSRSASSSQAANVYGYNRLHSSGKDLAKSYIPVTQLQSRLQTPGVAGRSQSLPGMSGMLIADHRSLVLSRCRHLFPTKGALDSAATTVHQ